MYNLIRITILIILILALFLSKKRVRLLKKKTKILGIFLFIFLLILLSFYPVENLFLRFSTPQESFHYSYWDKQIVNVMEYENNAIILFRVNSSSDSLYYIQRDSNGWKIASPNFSWNTKTAFFNNSIITYNKLDNSEISFIGLGDFVSENGQEKINSIIDSKGNQFNLQKLSSYGGYVNYFYSFIDTNKPNNYIIINGEKVTLN